MAHRCRDGQPQCLNYFLLVVGLCWLWRFSTLNSGSLKFQVLLGFAIIPCPTLTLSYFIAFSIAQTTPQLVCMWSVMKSPVKPAWIKWKLSMFSSRFFPRPSYIGWFFTFNVEDEILCCYHSNETSLAERLNSTVYFYALCKKVTVELCHFA